MCLHSCFVYALVHWQCLVTHSRQVQPGNLLALAFAIRVATDYATDSAGYRAPAKGSPSVAATARALAAGTVQAATSLLSGSGARTTDTVLREAGDIVGLGVEVAPVADAVTSSAPAGFMTARMAETAKQQAGKAVQGGTPRPVSRVGQVTPTAAAAAPPPATSSGDGNRGSDLVDNVLRAVELAVEVVTTQYGGLTGQGGR